MAETDIIDARPQKGGIQVTVSKNQLEQALKYTDTWTILYQTETEDVDVEPHVTSAWEETAETVRETLQNAIDLHDEQTKPGWIGVSCVNRRENTFLIDEEIPELLTELLHLHSQYGPEWFKIYDDQDALDEVLEDLEPLALPDHNTQEDLLAT